MRTIYLLILAVIMPVPVADAADPFADFGIEIPRTRVDAPGFTLTTIKGETVKLSNYHGKVVLLNFWATWCEPCRDEMPSMQALWGHFKDKDFVILAVAADRGNKKGIARFVGKYKLTYPVPLDPDGTVRNTYEVVGLPMTYLIGRDGKISGRLLSSRDWSSAASIAVIEDLLQR